jgi:hypothetical protein
MSGRRILTRRAGFSIVTIDVSADKLSKLRLKIADACLQALHCRRQWRRGFTAASGAGTVWSRIHARLATIRVTTVGQRSLALARVRTKISARVVRSLAIRSTPVGRHSWGRTLRGGRLAETLFREGSKRGVHGRRMLLRVMRVHNCQQSRTRRLRAMRVTQRKNRRQAIHDRSEQNRVVFLKTLEEGFKSLGKRELDTLWKCIDVNTALERDQNLRKNSYVFDQKNVVTIKNTIE